MRDVLVVGPQTRDRMLVAAAGLDRRYRIRYAGPDLDAVERFDAQALLDESLAGPADGVVGTKDRAALLAAVVAARRGLTGPAPDAVVTVQHKPVARERMRAVVPGATPRFFVPHGGPPPFPPPYFAKPAVGRLSQGAQLVHDLGALGRAPESYADGWAALAALAGVDLPPGFRGWIAEEPLHGREVTLEGYVHRGRVTTVGITDSLKYPGTNSFEAFAYPADLTPERDAELGAIAERLLPAFGFDGGFFNVEFFVPGDGPAKVIEANGRIASQFAPLVAATHGRSTYDALLALACGDDPRWETRPPDGAAVSYVVRVFEDALVDGVPEPEDGLEVLVERGRRLSEQRGANDVTSFRLAILSEAGETRAEALARARRRAERLSFRLRPAPPP
ncbi:MAG: ATP-grasp domain-containing protein [Thermoleophilia bacterium]|nr:ATP-grasp domain-containing protein [Thermoleophilia bacterium]